MADAKAGKGSEPRRVLGRGLDALLPAATSSAAARLDAEFQRVAIARVHSQKGQPRQRFEEQSLVELAQSIRQRGILQPIVVRRAGADFEIIAGERRWRAAQRAGLDTVPIVIKDVTPAAAFELALIENVQRADLDPMELADAYQRLMADHGYTQESLADRVGKNRATVANTLRLLQLPREVRARVVSGELSEGHARAILSARDPAEMARIARAAVDHAWTVRRTEKESRGDGTKRREKGATAKSANVRDLEKRLAAALGMKVAVKTGAQGKSGTVEIAFDDLDQLDAFIERVLGR